MNFKYKDKLKTIENKNRLAKNRNLLYWYNRLYDEQFFSLGDVKKYNVLEIGSGTSPLKKIYSSVMTSDILDLDYLDYCFDCHLIDEVLEIPDASLDIITITNVLHHLEMPIDFLKRAALKLKSGGHLIMAEPYFSVLSSFIYKRFHYEECSFAIDRPVISHVEGPLRTANLALPYLIFFADRGWDRELNALYDFDRNKQRPYTFLSYFITGGISRCFYIPHCIYKILHNVDSWLAKQYPNTFSSFFILEMVRK